MHLSESIPGTHGRSKCVNCECAHRERLLLSAVCSSGRMEHNILYVYRYCIMAVADAPSGQGLLDYTRQFLMLRSVSSISTPVLVAG